MARAILVIDVQKVYTDPASPLHCIGNAEAIANINAIVSTAEAAGDLVVHVRHVHRADGSDAGRMFDFSGEAGELGFVEGTQEVEDDPRLKIPAGALAIIKQRYSCFVGTGLEGGDSRDTGRRLRKGDDDRGMARRTRNLNHRLEIQPVATPPKSRTRIDVRGIMIKRKLGQSGLSIAPLVLGGNVFGWNVDEQTGFRLLDAFVDHGFNAIDTADVYSNWAPGNSGGESETMIGRWLKARPGMRDRVAIFTKVGSDMGGPDQKGLSRRWILEAAEHSLRRLGTDVIDLYFAHVPDPETPQEESLSAFGTLLEAGKIRSIGASNFDADQLRGALALSGSGLPRYTVVQPEYNLHDRLGFEGPLQDFCVKEGIGAVTYFSLASGFLSGKYRDKADLLQSVRGEDVEKYLTPRGFALLDALHAVADRRDASPSEVALAWLMAQPAVVAPIASATKPEHISSFARAADLQLTAEDLAQLAI